MAPRLQKPATLFWLAAAVLLIWNLVGAFACIQQFRLGAEAMGPATDYDRALFASLPIWYNWVFALAEVAGLGGVAALFAKSAMARPLFIVSLVAVIVQFGYLFLVTDILAQKGSGTAYFPIFIAVMGAFQIWFAGHAEQQGWIGGRSAIDAGNRR